MEHQEMAPNFIRGIVENDVRSGKVKEVVTRFPPEPNGYLHIGHAKSIVLNFELARTYNGKVNLRFDDTNPLKEDQEYVKAIQEDVSWLGFKWDGLFFASDYFDEMYERALLLIRKQLAYVDDLSADEIRAARGSLTEPGQNSPYRDRSVEENLDLFTRMRAGEYGDGEKVLRAKIDMASPNLNLRDPVFYRIAHVTHHNTGDKWCIYPMYAYAHALEDAIEGITHSICTLEFEDQRALYDWVISSCEMPHVPKQYEFARLNMTRTLMSKRKLKQLVDEQLVDGWNDPRMPTLSGLRRRGVPPEALCNFVRAVGVSKSNSVVDTTYLDHFIRDDLKLKTARMMGVLRPLKVIITNYPEGQVEMLEGERNADVPDMGSRQIPFSREIYIEEDDFMEDPPSKYFRLSPGKEVRLKYAYFIKCEEVIKDQDGRILELRCTYDPETKSGTGFTGRKVKGTIHWVEATQAVAAKFRLYEPLVLDERGEDSHSPFNPNSLCTYDGFIEWAVQEMDISERMQLFRHGYFSIDSKESQPSLLVLNLIVALKSSFK